MSATTPKNANRPSPLACIACRNKHLKCDGRMPVCSRCKDSNRQCIFTKSRRGYRGPRRQENAAPALSQSLHGLGAQNVEHTRDPTLNTSPTETGLSLSDETVSIAREDLETTNDNMARNDEHLIDLFYRFFRPAHPIVIPQQLYLQDRTVLPHHLKQVMRFLGSHFCDTDPYFWQERTLESISSTEVTEDAFKVQSLLLFALASFVRSEHERGITVLTEAVQLAYRIGLNRPEFGCNQSSIIQESWRRTWWELYITVSTITPIMPNGLNVNAPWDIPLPGNCEDYENCVYHPGRTLQQMQERYFAADNFRWSSSAYRIEATRILRMVLDINDELRGASKSQIGSAKAAIASFILSLPPEKRNATSKTGDIDEVMFFALTIIDVAALILHLPRSGLSGVQSLKTSCWNSSIIITDDCVSHKHAAIKTANNVSQLISGINDIQRCSPCIICPITYATIVHFSAYLETRDASEAQGYKERIQLALSVLGRMGEIWPYARVVRGQIAQFAREILCHSRDEFMKPRCLGTTTADNELDDEFDNQEWLQELMDAPADFLSRFDLANTSDFAATVT